MESDGEGQGSTFFFELPLLRRRRLASLLSLSALQNGSQSPEKVEIFAGAEMGGSGWTALTRSGPKVFPEESESQPHDPKSSSLERSLSWQLINLSSYSQEPADISKGEVEEDEVASCYVTILPSLPDTVNMSFSSTSLSVLPTHGLRALVVDDSVSNRKVLNKLLSRLGYIVEEAADGLAFLEKVGVATATSSVPAAADKLMQYEFVMIDDNMPRMCGPEAVSVARAAGYRGLIFGLTGNTSPEQLEAFKQKGTDFVFTKPLDIAKLSKMLEMNSLFRIL